VFTLVETIQHPCGRYTNLAEEPELSFNHLTELENNIHLFPVGFCPIHAFWVILFPLIFFPVNNLKILPLHGVLTLVEITSSNPMWNFTWVRHYERWNTIKNLNLLYIPENNVKVISSRYPSNRIQQVLTTLSPPAGFADTIMAFCKPRVFWSVQKEQHWW